MNLLTPPARAAVAAALVALTAAPAAAQTLQFLGRYTSPAGNTAAEISAFDPASQRLFVTNAALSRVDVLDLSNPAAPMLVGNIPFATTPNSVAVSNGRVAIAVEAAIRQNPGTVQFFDTGSLAGLGSFTVGAIPDSITFSPDGTRVLVPNEGEPNNYNAGNVDPDGTVSIITLPGGNLAGATVQTIPVITGFVPGLRGGAPGTTQAQNAEPEFITVSADSRRAYVTLQESNAIATIDLDTPTPSVIAVKPLGTKDFSLAGNGIDPSDRDNEAGDGPSDNIRQVPVRGLYMPDAIANFDIGGQTFLITANEGDSRDYAGFTDESRVSAGAYQLDPTAYPNAATLKGNGPNGLGRLTVSRIDGDTDNDGDIDQITAFGARSFSILDAGGNLVYDSGDDLEQITLATAPALFNSDGTPASFDTRSDNKGPEPEGVVVGEAFGRTLAFVGLERVGGFMMFDVSDPSAPVFLEWIGFGGPDLAPEGLLFVSAADSPTGAPLIVTTNELSGTTAVYALVPEPASAGLLMSGGALALLRRRRRA